MTTRRMLLAGALGVATLLSRGVGGIVDVVDRQARLLRLAEIHERGRNDLAAAFDALSEALVQDAGLEPADVERFHHALAEARIAVRSADEGELVECAKHALDRVPLARAPLYVRDRIQQVQRLIGMLEDDAWALPSSLRNEVLSALVYFSDPDDMIPDALPVIGLLDDAIMLELLLREERDLLVAYDAFCTFRRGLGSLPDDLAARTAWCSALSGERARLIAGLKASRAIY